MLIQKYNPSLTKVAMFFSSPVAILLLILTLILVSIETYSNLQQNPGRQTFV